jgi:uncharacterized protein (TIGR00661 family)
MKILYGVQGTGNGHISRARAMADAFKNHSVHVDYVFSGRDPDKFFDMEPFGDYRVLKGLTFRTKAGRIQPLATVLKNNVLAFVRDIKKLDLSQYDLVLSDYEPITAWAGKRQGVKVIGLGHQYAFHHPIPQHHGSFIQHLIIKYFAPVTKSLGFHWHHFDHPILPPIAPVEKPTAPPIRGHYTVYLPFESIDDIRILLQPFSDYRFAIYHPEATPSTEGHLCWHKPARDSFQKDIRRSEGILCNAGFMLASEVLQIGRKLMIKPVRGQSEQYSNALALDALGYGHVMYDLNEDKVGKWLKAAHATQIVFPDVAEAICHWLLNGAKEDIADLAHKLWQQTELPEMTALTRTDFDLEVEPVKRAAR